MACSTLVDCREAAGLLVYAAANDGATILDQMEVENQIGRLLVELSRWVVGWERLRGVEILRKVSQGGSLGSLHGQPAAAPGGMLPAGLMLRSSTCGPWQQLQQQQEEEEQEPQDRGGVTARLGAAGRSSGRRAAGEGHGRPRVNVGWAAANNS